MEFSRSIGMILLFSLTFFSLIISPCSYYLGDPFPFECFYWCSIKDILYYRDDKDGDWIALGDFNPLSYFWWIGIHAVV
jgi:hypothetical protein